MERASASEDRSDEPSWRPATLDEARLRIDGIDSAILDLLIQRAEIVGHVAELKARDRARPPLNAVRPAREMQMLRRLRADTHAPLGFSAVFAIWREIVAAFTDAQMPLGLSVLDAQEADTLRLARDAFGAAPTILRRSTVQAVLADLAAAPGKIGIVPAHPPDGWWRLLPQDGPKVILALPLIGVEIDAFCIGSSPLEPSGDDITLATDGERLLPLDGFHATPEAGLTEAGAAQLGGDPALRLLGVYPRPLPPESS